MRIKKYELESEKMKAKQEKRDKFWQKHSDIKDSIAIIASIVASVIAIFTLIIVAPYVVVPGSNLDFCPSISISENYGCSYSPQFSCGDIKEIEYSCGNDGVILIYSDIYNKGLALSNNIEMEITMNNIAFNESSRHMPYSYIVRRLDGTLMGETSALSCAINNDTTCRLTETIYVLMPNESKRFFIQVPEELFSKHPDNIVFVLKENGKVIETKTLRIKYKNSIQY